MRARSEVSPPCSEHSSARPSASRSRWGPWPRQRTPTSAPLRSRAGSTNGEVGARSRASARRRTSAARSPTSGRSRATAWCWTPATGRGRRLADIEGGQVDAVVPDGSGGWFIGGDFDKVGGQSRPNIAHIRRTRRSTRPGTPSPTTRCSAMVALRRLPLHRRLFSEIGSERTTRLAALSATTGVPRNDWIPSAGGANNVVTGMVQVTSAARATIVVAGRFTQLNSNTHRHVGRVRASDGASDGGWTPGVMDDDVTTIIEANGLIVATGSFDEFDDPEQHAPTSSGTASPSCERAHRGAHRRGPRTSAAASSTPSPTTAPAVHRRQLHLDQGAVDRRRRGPRRQQRRRGHRLEPGPADRPSASRRSRRSRVQGAEPRRRRLLHEHRRPAAATTSRASAAAARPATRSARLAQRHARTRTPPSRRSRSPAPTSTSAATSAARRADRRNLAALNSTPATATPWNPGADGRAVLTSNLATRRPRPLYVGGSFATVAGQAHANLVALDRDGDAVVAAVRRPERPGVQPRAGRRRVAGCSSAARSRRRGQAPAPRSARRRSISRTARCLGLGARRSTAR